MVLVWFWYGFGLVLVLVWFGLVWFGAEPKPYQTENIQNGYVYARTYEHTDNEYDGIIRYFFTLNLSRN